MRESSYLILRLRSLLPALKVFFSASLGSLPNESCQTITVSSTSVGTLSISKEPSSLVTAKYGWLKVQIFAFIQGWRLQETDSGVDWYLTSIFSVLPGGSVMFCAWFLLGSPSILV